MLKYLFDFELKTTIPLGGYKRIESETANNPQKCSIRLLLGEQNVHMGRSLNRSTKPATALVPSKFGRSRNLPYQLLMRK